MEASVALGSVLRPWFLVLGPWVLGPAQDSATAPF
jgi:hypothetical protein